MAIEQEKQLKSVQLEYDTWVKAVNIKTLLINNGISKNFSEIIDYGLHLYIQELKEQEKDE